MVGASPWGNSTHPLFKRRKPWWMPAISPCHVFLSASFPYCTTTFVHFCCLVIWAQIAWLPSNYGNCCLVTIGVVKTEKAVVYLKNVTYVCACVYCIKFYLPKCLRRIELVKNEICWDELILIEGFVVSFRQTWSFVWSDGLGLRCTIRQMTRSNWMSTRRHSQLQYQIDYAGND